MKNFSTKAVHVGNKPNYQTSGDVVVPIHLSSTFARKKVYQATGGYEYSRTGNPTRLAVEKNLASLEEGRIGLAYSSGLAAETNIALLLKAGDHVIVGDDVYGGTRRLFDKVFEKFNLTFSYIDLSGEKGANRLEKSIQKKTKMVWIESPTNPLLKISDIKKISDVARKNNLITVVDNTFASPYFQKPLELGVDIVLHSTTKYLGGHSDTVGGAIVVNNKALAKRLKFLQNAVGAILSPFDSWLLLRGIKTLELRMEKHQKNAITIAKFLQGHKSVKKIYYPGLKNHSGHKIAKKQMSGFSGVLSFELKASLEQTIKFIEALKLILVAESLGAVESLIEHPASMTHASIDPKERKKIGLSDGLIRLSVGIESSDDLINDLKQALTKLRSKEN